MSESSVKQAFRSLAEQAVQQVAASEHPLEYFGGATALQAMRRDQVITALPTFEETRTTLGSLPIVQELYGAAGSPDGEHAWDRLALQFVYGFLGNLSEPTFDNSVFESTWEVFWAELRNPHWNWVCIANLRHFFSEVPQLDFGDGVTILYRDLLFEKFGPTYWTQWPLEPLQREWLEGAMLSSHVIIVEQRIPKTPENFLDSSDLAAQAKISRLLLALRILKQGDIGIGRMWFLRRDDFDFGLLGGASTGVSDGFIFGSPYTLNESELNSLRQRYNELVRFEDVQEGAPVNINLAFAFFSNAFDHRGTLVYYTRLIDNVTAMEALLGTTTEISFKLANRVAGILGNDDDERVAIFEQMKNYYDTRSRVVHGEPLKAKHQQYLTDSEPLRSFLRRLLVGFVRLTLSSDPSFGKTFFKEKLDSTLLHPGRRSELRRGMGLE